MDENTIFNIKQEKVENPNLVVIPPAENYKDDDSSSLLKTILKVVIGITVVGLVLFVVFSFILPRFLNKKAENVTLTYWGLWEDKSAMQVVINDFEKQNPNIKIDYIKQDIKQYRERVAARIQNGTGPDIFRFHNTWTPMFVSYLSPMSSDTIKKEDFKKWFYPVAQTDLIKNGAIYGIPLEIDTLALFINIDSFKAANLETPKTWDDFSRAASVATGVTVKDENGKIKNAGAAMGTFDNITHAPDIISLLLLQNRADLKNLSGSAQNAADAFNFYLSFSQGTDNVWDNSLDQSLLAFSKGNLSMFFGYSWDVITIKGLNPNLNFAVHPVPHLPDRNITIASYWVEGVSVKSNHQKEAQLFMKVLAQKETEQKLFSEVSKTRIFGEPYARVDLADSLKQNSSIYPFVQQGNDAVSSFFVSDTYDNGLNSQMNNYLGNAIRASADNSSIQSAIETLSKGVSQVLQQYGIN